MLPWGGAAERNAMCALFALFARLQQGDSYVYQEEIYAKEDKEWEEQDREADMASSCN